MTVNGRPGSTDQRYDEENGPAKRACKMKERHDEVKKRDHEVEIRNRIEEDKTE